MSEILLLNARRKGKARKRRSKKTATRKRPARKRPTRRRPARKTATRRKPAARRVAAKRKGAYTMARKRRKATKRRAPRRNPSRRRVRRRITRRAGGALAGLNFKTALKNIPIATVGMFAAKWAAKRFGEPASETDPASWNYASYLKGAGGAAAAGFLANMLKPGMGQKVLEGGMSLMLYKLLQNELIAGNTFWSGQLGATERVPGVVEENEAGEPFILGEDYEWYPLDGADDYRMEPDMPILGEALVEPGPLGEALVEPGPLGYDGYGADLDTMYAESFLQR